ncbi:hypothetical protein XYCOK13_27990 [Xylanibacillus composti]|uniref:Flagellar protein FliT n=1 Tax=Xylanibacillus composti TaxID=1572762 RepID=A0A8J4M2K8_9BACL|nr:hypothetical protein [Xylanibacillus composti]GIQ69975.1 hypothetical protein XYCOK13_27990 [Xylanibacillus composti]
MAQASEHLDLYERLLLVSGQLLEWAEATEWDDQVLAKGSALQREWNELQEMIRAKEEKLGIQLSQLPYADELRPIAERIAKMQEVTASVLQERMSMLGKSMKGLQQTKTVLNAYAEPEEAVHTAYFFDEKK